MPTRILVVDDSPSLRALVRCALTDASYEVDEAHDGVAGLERLEKGERPQLIICDVNMPRMNGLAFIKAIKASPLHRVTPIVMLTTETQRALLEEAKAVGIRAWLVKPLDPKTLVELVKRVLKT